MCNKICNIYVNHQLQTFRLHDLVLFSIWITFFRVHLNRFNKIEQIQLMNHHKPFSIFNCNCYTKIIYYLVGNTDDFRFSLRNITIQANGYIFINNNVISNGKSIGKRIRCVILKRRLRIIVIKGTTTIIILYIMFVILMNFCMSHRELLCRFPRNEIFFLIRKNPFGPYYYDGRCYRHQSAKMHRHTS